MSPDTFDAIIIGAGQAGPSLAGRLNDAGMKVAIIERHLVGGTCVNTGCKPTKTLVASAYAAHTARRGSEYGFTIGGPIEIDMRAVAARARKIILDSRAGNESWLAGMSNVELIRGHARFIASHTIAVGERELTAPLIFVNVGGRANIPNAPGVGEVPLLTNTDIVALEKLPRHLVVVGGSYIGLEFAQMYRRFGSEVTIVERSDRLIAREDPDVSDEIRAILEREGVTIRLGADCIGFERRGDEIAVSVNCESNNAPVIGSHVLMAVGRRPNTDDLGLDKAGIDTDGQGYITVDDRLQTNIPGVYALGDCNGRGAFTHTAYNDFEIVAANLLDGEDRTVDQRIVGYALYIDPPLARVGMTDAAAEKSGRRLLFSKRPMSRVGRAVEKGESQGFMKIVADADTRQILGAAILGTGGDEAIHGVLDMMHAGQTIDTFRWALPIHPTVSELLPTLLLDLKNRGS
ncbi:MULTISPECIES: FAD-containing oxidoreductase [Rhizobium]|uniref:FAD-containing oxidoreductase n=1 Tax=Rhizobium tropici TaxID=398 RepID=A0A6P1C740_RHITR|nr:MULTISPECIES: FAD-containing oxidoreductase [Rhizobium]AGB73826.1 putative pyridine nucleotide-disulfide oxidoreductase [Rhizobium tropici CIAT 899]MBB4244476.1 pyruvate/2-oxoglutarate dehydrogenase complex dihydrolipoamide dehydrogenase (E3) component [Rhizobium tropici]MBB5595678.1 pyruvate/2-oxoglutarate dehydrogenase complex dihydrolipoamide dehydrogenase (E3) component [Rhizobium tropici]MBB6494815.1 pyruvate/2-oxoglutarate dehydrogenase complex dihydrolipoamide dehydrogenase (E3) compo